MVMSTTVPIKVETLTAFADEARRIEGVENELSTDEMIAVFGSASKEIALPNAEESDFGTQETGVTEYSTVWHERVNSLTNQSGKHYGHTLVVNEPFSLHGFRMPGTVNATFNIKVWDADTLDLVAEAQITTPHTDDNTWYEKYLSVPVNLTKGKRYTISQAGTSALAYNKNRPATFSPKITWEPGLKIGPTGECPTEITTEQYNLTSAVCLLMGLVLEEKTTTEYKIQTQTMDAFANEVKRITGASGTLSPSEIVTALQGIASTT